MPVIPGSVVDQHLRRTDPGFHGGKCRAEACDVAQVADLMCYTWMGRAERSTSFGVQIDEQDLSSLIGEGHHDLGANARGTTRT